jgi:hypothetical protein
MTHDRTAAPQEDRDRALDLAAQEMSECGRLSRQIYGADNVTMCSFPNKGDWPPGDCADTMMSVIIGVRGNLTKNQARTNAAMWREVVARYPKAMLYISVLGYSADPRELWEFPDVCRYVRWWARFAGMDDIDAANRLIGMESPLRAMPHLVASNMGFLAACGCFGEAMRQHALRNHRATPQH